MQPIICSRSRPRFLRTLWTHAGNVVRAGRTHVQNAHSTKRAQVSDARRLRLVSLAALALSACASASLPPTQVPEQRLSPTDEAYALQAAQQQSSAAPAPTQPQ